MTQKFNRHSIRLKEYDYSLFGWYFVTICTCNAKMYFGEVIDGNLILNNIGKIIEEEWLRTKAIRKNVDLDYYIVMPNHVHGIIIIDNSVGAIRRIAQNNLRANQRFASTLQSNSLGAIIGQFKSVSTKRIRKTGLTNFKWQRNYYERII